MRKKPKYQLGVYGLLPGAGREQVGTPRQHAQQGGASLLAGVGIQPSRACITAHAHESLPHCREGREPRAKEADTQLLGEAESFSQEPHLTYRSAACAAVGATVSAKFSVGFHAHLFPPPHSPPPQGSALLQVQCLVLAN